MKIIKDTRATNGWITAVIEGRYCEAKLYDEPSHYGINEGRISKLAILKGPARDRNANYFNQCDFIFDRGLDFDNLPTGVLDKIVGKLEALPAAM